MNGSEFLFIGWGWGVLFFHDRVSYVALAVLGLPLQTRLALNSEISPASSSQVQGLELGVPYHTQHRVALFDMTKVLMSCEFPSFHFTH